MEEQPVAHERPPIWTKSFTCCFLASLFTCIAYYPFNPTLPLYLEEHLHFSGSAIGLIVAFYAYSALISRPWVGHALDTLSRKTFYVVCLGCFALSFLGYGVAVTITALLILRAVQGILWGGVTAASSTVVADIVPLQRRGEGLSLYGMSMPLAMGIGPILGMLLYEEAGFTSVWLQATILGLIAFAMAISIKHKSHHIHQPHYEKPKLSIGSMFYGRGIPSSLCMLLFAFPQGIAVSFAGMYGKQINFDYPYLYYVLLSVGAIISRFIVGKNMDKGYLKPIMIIAAGMMILAYVMLGIGADHHMFMGAGLLSGVGFGMLMPCIVMMVMNLAPPEERGKANGTFFTFMDLGFGSGILFGGVISQYFSLNGSFIGAATIDFVGIAVMILFALPHYQKFMRLKRMEQQKLRQST